jgi:hypothetical protein
VVASSITGLAGRVPLETSQLKADSETLAEMPFEVARHPSVKGILRFAQNDGFRAAPDGVPRIVNAL